MNYKVLATSLALLGGLTLIGVMLASVGGITLPARAAPTAPQATIRYVAPGGSCGAIGGGTPVPIQPCYGTVQAAVSAADAGDIIKIAAGTYTDTHTIVYYTQLITSVAYISKSLTLRGGYTSSDWTIADPIAHPTTLDAQGKGRVLYITLHNQAVTIEGLRLTGGDASRGDSLGQGGGGLYALGWLQGSAITLTNNHITNNSARGDGGGLNLWGITATLTGNSIISNTSQNLGGGILLYFTVAQLKNNLILSNTAPTVGNYDGGGLRVMYSTVTLIGNTIANNRASSGAGIYILRSPITLIGNTFSANVAGTYGAGGGLDYVGTNNASEVITATNNTFIRNSANSGGGAFLSNVTGTLAYNVFDSNSAGENGGGLVVGGNAITLSGNRITSNTVTYEGGGLSLSGNPVISGNIITGNVANKGGGLYSSGFNNSNPLLINNLIADNRVTASYLGAGWGSAVYLDGSTARLLHDTLARNTGGDGSGLFITNTTGTHNLALTNTILISHAVGLYVARGNSAAIDGVLWYSSPITLTAEAVTTVTVQHQYSGDPQFDLDGYHLLSGSLALDHGVNANATIDIDGQARPNGQTPDLGADEWYPPLDQHVYLPLVRK